MVSARLAHSKLLKRELELDDSDGTTDRRTDGQ